MAEATAVLVFVVLIGMGLVAVGLIVTVVLDLAAACLEWALALVSGRRRRFVPPDARRRLASARERDLSASLIAQGYAEGRLALPELDKRVGQALRARTQGDLALASAGLAGGESAAGAAAPLLGLAGLALVLLGGGAVRIAGTALAGIALIAPARVRPDRVALAAAVLVPFSWPAALAVGASLVPGLCRGERRS